MSESKEFLSSPPDLTDDPDPFTNRLSLTRLDLLKCAVGTVLFLPLRAAGVVTALLMSWVMARIGLLGLPPHPAEGLPERTRCPAGWRRALKGIYSYLGLLVFWAAGFRVTFRGRQCRRSEAPILVGAPHSSFLEAMLVIMCRCSPVSRHENRDAFLIWACQEFYDTIFVDRRKAESRSAAAQAICDRSVDNNDDDEWSQLFIFPEGTNTNRKKLIQFKRGAFNPGVPVQPVVIRYVGYDEVDSITWTFRQDHSYLYSVWLILVRPVNKVEIEFMPVYNPSEEERKDPDMFAKNVQCVMAERLGLFASDTTYYKYLDEHCQREAAKKKKKNSVKDE